MPLLGTIIDVSSEKQPRNGAERGDNMATIKEAGKTLEITSKRFWTRGSVRSACVNNNLYTGGDNEEYEHMLDWVDRMYPNTENLYFIAKNIYCHSADQTITNIMFILEQEAIYTTYEINGSDEI